MTLRLLQIGNSLPFSWIVDPNATFQSGAVGQLNAFSNTVVCGVSDGTAPIGIIDDIKSTTFSAASINEQHIIPVSNSAVVNGTLVTTIDYKQELDNSNIIAKSYMADVNVALNPKNGVITIPAGTPLNFSLLGTQPDSVRIISNYSYFIPNIPGDDSTKASGRVTVWFMKMLAATDQFETNQRYPLNAPLFSSESGLLTTRMSFPNQPAIAQVTAPATRIGGLLEFVTYF